MAAKFASLLMPILIFKLHYKLSPSPSVDIIAEAQVSQSIDASNKSLEETALVQLLIPGWDKGLPNEANVHPTFNVDFASHRNL